MDATLLSHEASKSHHAVAYRNSILELRSSAINPDLEYWNNSAKRSRTIAGNLPNHGSNDLKYSTIPLRAAIRVLTGGVEIRSAVTARLAAATMASPSEGIKLPC
ncbi:MULTISPECIES: hypothetical protein [unclassified Phyllobacterium]|uniref:hypothetical protein n=1 Tax=unclassified Phyllobacterium TaxID=2638441 RepID=UPI003012E5CA